MWNQSDGHVCFLKIYWPTHSQSYRLNGRILTSECEEITKFDYLNFRSLTPHLPWLLPKGQTLFYLKLFRSIKAAALGLKAKEERDVCQITWPSHTLRNTQTNKKGNQERRLTTTLNILELVLYVYDARVSSLGIKELKYRERLEEGKS